MNGVPIIRPTTCPQIDELGDKSKRWAIVYTVGGRGYLGRIVDGEDTGIVRLADPFDYASGRTLVGDKSAPRIAMQRQEFPCEHFDIEEILVHVDVIIALHRLSPKALESIRESLIQAWEGRVHLRNSGGRVNLATADTKIT